MRRYFCILTCLCFLTCPALGQIDPLGDGRGTVFYVDSTVAPNSFEELLTLSPLVVTGLVDAVLPTHLTNPSNPNSSVESDVIILVDKVIKGGNSLTAQTGFKRVVVSQLGGRYKGQMILPSRDSLLEPGQRYILFLGPDDRVNEPNIAGLPRYLVVGVWAGKFISERLGGVHASFKSLAGLHVMDSKTEAELVVFLQKLLSVAPVLAQ